ncbi:MAG: hypothetical protein IKE60_26430 [Reyranella sp.]|uniref:hypothetical protein n=1 Tax=Reyranella sp. TaxID=1929291 RepID=UPI0025F05CDB|nr:hypothetical protein [Reyranella sp.]MBR2818227.1 hypothetical protein [Reyranella sp.]
MRKQIRDEALQQANQQAPQLPQQPVASSPVQNPAPAVVPQEQLQPTPPIDQTGPAPAASPSDVGVLGRIFGYGDQTPDARTGLTPGERGQMGFSTLAQLGGLLMAAGQPMAPSERARYLAGMGNIPANNQQMAEQFIKQRAGNVQLAKNQTQLEATQRLRAMWDDPEFQKSIENLPQATKAVIRMHMMNGDTNGMQSVIRDSRPKLDAQGNITTADGRIVDWAGRTVFDPSNPNAGPASPGSSTKGKPLGYDWNRMDEEGQRAGLDMSTLKQIEQEYGAATAQQVFQWATYKSAFPVNARSAAATNPNGRDATLMRLTQSVNPNWTTADFQNQQKVWDEYLNKGKSAQNLRALDTASGHIAQAIPVLEKLGNGDTQSINQARNWFQTQFGKEAPTNASALVGGIVHELATVFRASGMSLAEIEDWQKKFNTNMSPAQWQGLIETGLHMMKTRRVVIEEQYQNAMKLPQRQSLMTPTAKKEEEEAERRISELRASRGGSVQGAPSSGSAAPAVGTVVGRTKDGREVYIGADGQRRVR